MCSAFVFHSGDRTRRNLRAPHGSGRCSQVQTGLTDLGSVAKRTFGNTHPYMWTLIYRTVSAQVYGIGTQTFAIANWK